jgi:Protein of unknown function DUF262
LSDLESPQPAEDVGRDAEALELREQEQESGEPLDISAEERRLVTQPYDFSVSSLIEDIDSDRLLLSLDYQRDYVWDDSKASRLIESLLLNVPIPVCYFAENDDGTLEVVDGQQRLKSIWRFVSDRAEDDALELRGLPVLTELNGSTFTKLASRDQRRLQNRTIRCVVITEDSHPDIKFDVFERLNTGAVRLTDQELRNSIYRGSFNDALKDAAAVEAFRELLSGQLITRQSDTELVLRFVALADRLTAYKPPLRQFLNEYMRDHQSNPETVTGLLDGFRETAETTRSVFGARAFRRFTAEGSAGILINKALFDCIMISFYLADQAQVLEHKDEVRDAMAGLLSDHDFEVLIGRATADRTRMFGRIGAFSEKLQELGITTTFREVLPQERN